MNRNSFPHLLGAALASAFALASLPAAAGNKLVAEALFKVGQDLMKQGKYDEACPKFVESQKQDPATGTLIALAGCYDKAGKNASAWAQYKDLAFQFKLKGNVEGEKAAREKADELEKHLSKLQINAVADTPGLVIHRDEEDVGTAILGTAVPADPGPHVIQATAPGFNVWQTTVTIPTDGSTQTVQIPTLTEKPKPPNNLRTVSFIVGGVGGAGLLVGAITGGLAASAASAVKTDCPKNVCTGAAAQGERASANTKALVSTISLAAGGAALAGGVVLFIVARNKKDDARATTGQIVPTFGPTGGGLSFIGAF